MGILTNDESTSRAYKVRFEQLWARCDRETHGQLSWSGFIDWLVLLKGTLRPSSWRQYRASVVHALEAEVVGDAEAFMVKLMQSSLPDHPRRHELALRTSSSKMKSLPVDDFEVLADHLLKQNGRWDDLASRWLVYGSITGLRPREWQQVKIEAIDDDEIVLLVQNAKNDSVRSHGVQRRIHLFMDCDNQLRFARFLEKLNGFAFDDVYRGCRMALWRACRTLWPRRKRNITLYSGRHQFAANAKFSGLLPEEIAALMGHAVTETHQAHYGKRRCGRGSVRVLADERDVERVMERMQLKAEAGVKGLSPGVRSA